MDKSNDPAAGEESRTAIMFKGELLGLLGLMISPNGNSVSRTDLRATPQFQRSPYPEADAARRGFRNMVRDSRRNGWTVAYVGPPLFG